MPKNSGPTDRNIGLTNTNGKGDKSRVTDVQAYRQNFENINWKPVFDRKKLEACITDDKNYRRLGLNEPFQPGDEASTNGSVWFTIRNHGCCVQTYMELTGHVLTVRRKL